MNLNNRLKLGRIIRTTVMAEQVDIFSIGYLAVSDNQSQARPQSIIVMMRI